MEIATASYCETLNTGKWGRIVSQSSANPGIEGVFTVPVTEDHLTIASPKSPDELVPKDIQRFINENLQPSGIPDATSIGDFMKQLNESRPNPADFQSFKDRYKNKRMTWDAYVLRVTPATPSATRLSTEAPVKLRRTSA